jgi:hypothetical protein
VLRTSQNMDVNQNNGVRNKQSTPPKNKHTKNC